MNTVDCIKTRRSVRKFTEEKVPHEVLEQLVELSRRGARCPQAQGSCGFIERKVIRP